MIEIALHTAVHERILVHSDANQRVFPILQVKLNWSIKDVY